MFVNTAGSILWSGMMMVSTTVFRRRAMSVQCQAQTRPWESEAMGVLESRVEEAPLNARQCRTREHGVLISKELVVVGPEAEVICGAFDSFSINEMMECLCAPCKRKVRYHWKDRTCKVVLPIHARVDRRHRLFQEIGVCPMFRASSCLVLPATRLLPQPRHDPTITTTQGNCVASSDVNAVIRHTRHGPWTY